jgi:hypothetical protein
MVSIRTVSIMVLPQPLAGMDIRGSERKEHHCREDQTDIPHGTLLTGRHEDVTMPPLRSGRVVEALRLKKVPSRRRSNGSIETDTSQVRSSSHPFVSKKAV